MQPAPYDALLFLSFGGPEQPADVMPFLENVLRGRDVPRARMLEVAENYLAFGGKSPINDQNRALIAALRAELAAHGHALPVFWGNRNWHPLLSDTLGEMAREGVRSALVFVTSAYSSYSACRQYLEDIDRARAKVGPGAPLCVKLPRYCLRDGFLGPLAERLAEALGRLPEARRAAAHLLFTAHSIPLAMSRGARYVDELTEVARRTAAAARHPEHRLVYQSRSGPPQQPWLEPDVRDALSEIAAAPGSRDVVLQPIGFISDHMEVVVDLDTQAREHAEALGLNLIRGGTVGTHPRFVSMIRELVEERLADPQAPEPCAEGCCPPR